jgi:mannan endo-1,4-beta-mannosidase
LTIYIDIGTRVKLLYLSKQEWVQEMAPYVKSIDNIHLLGVGMEGFYGDSIQDRKQYNPQGFQVGTDFITNHLIKEIDFATIHAYPDAW